MDISMCRIHIVGRLSLFRARSLKMGPSWPQKGFKYTERSSVVLLFFCSPIVLPLSACRLSACRLLPPPFFAWPLLCALCPRWYISPVQVPKQKIFCSVSQAMGKQTNALSPHLLILYFFATQNFNTFSIHFRFSFGRHINPTNFLFGKGCPSPRMGHDQGSIRYFEQKS